MTVVEGYTVAQVRLDPQRVARVQEMKAQTGMTTSQLFRRLIDAAEVKPASITVHSEVAKSAEALTGNTALFTK